MNILKRKGFTLIELLIVIVIIGILAAAVITAINPVEQINKAKDSSKMSAANELVKAITVYYTSSASGLYPWDVSTADDTPVATGAEAGSTVTGAAWLTGELASSSDIKASLTDRDFTGLTIFLDGNIPEVCFDPTSSSYGDKASYLVTGLSDSDGSYICVK